MKKHKSNVREEQDGETSVDQEGGEIVFVPTVVLNDFHDNLVHTATQFGYGKVDCDDSLILKQSFRADQEVQTDGVEYSGEGVTRDVSYLEITVKNRHCLSFTLAVIQLK